MTYRVRERADSFVAIVLAIMAFAFVAIGLWAVATYGLTELYADQWRFYVTYLEQPFPASALKADNGHRSVFPALIRLAEIRFFSGNQLLQLGTGALFALSAWLVISAIAWRETSLSRSMRWLAIAMAAFALFWLGNARMLLHGNEADTLYLIAICLAGALALLLSAHATTTRLVCACLLAFVATFSFGPGLAVFASLVVVSLLQHRYRQAVIVAVAMTLVLAIYMTLPGGDGVRNSLDVRPLENAHMAATWLSSMWIHLLAPLINPDVGGALPFGIGHVTRTIAVAYESTFGSVEANTTPAAVIGWMGVLGLFWMTWRSWRQEGESTQLRLLGLGIAWFALGVAGIVSLGRLDYFLGRPGQIFANRYVPWSCLFWLGVLTAFLAGGTERHQRRWTIVPASAATAGALVLGLLTTRGHLIWSELVQQGLRLDSAAFVSGVIDADRSLGETLPEEVERGMKPVRDAGLAAFAWPEARRIGLPLRADQTEQSIEQMQWEIMPAKNRLDGRAVKIRTRFRRLADIDMPPRLLVIAGDRAVGVLVRQTTLPGWSYAGYAAGEAVASERLGILRLRADGSIDCWGGCTASR